MAFPRSPRLMTSFMFTSMTCWPPSGVLRITRTRPGEEYEHLVVLGSGGAPDVVALDPNALEGAGAAHLDLGLVEPSPDGRLIAYSVDVTGDEVYELRFRDLAKKHVKLDESTRCKPDDGPKETYARLLAKQSDLTKRLHAAGYL